MELCHLLNDSRFPVSRIVSQHEIAEPYRAVLAAKISQPREWPIHSACINSKYSHSCESLVFKALYHIKQTWKTTCSMQFGTITCYTLNWYYTLHQSNQHDSAMPFLGFASAVLASAASKPLAPGRGGSPRRGPQRLLWHHESIWLCRTYPQLCLCRGQC